jgi:hypothetical protein
MGKRLKDTDFDIEGFIDEHLQKGLIDMSKRYSKEEVVLIINSYREQAWINGNDWDSYIKWLKVTGLIDEPNIKPIEAPTNKRKKYSVQDEIERKERAMEDNTPSLDKVMEAIERAEERLRMNSKHIHILLQAVNTLLDDKIDGTLVEQTNE